MSLSSVGCLIEQLSGEKYECMVCCDIIRLMAPVWSCQSCFHVFHLNCIKKWARSPASQADGRLLSSADVTVTPCVYCVDRGFVQCWPVQSISTTTVMPVWTVFRTTKVAIVSSATKTSLYSRILCLMITAYYKLFGFFFFFFKLLTSFFQILLKGGAVQPARTLHWNTLLPTPASVVSEIRITMCNYC